MNEDPQVEIGKYVRRCADRIREELTRNASITGRPPDRRALDAIIEQERRAILAKEDQSQSFKNVLLDLLEMSAEILREEIRG